MAMAMAIHPPFLVEISCVITKALWSREGSAMVSSVHPPAASMVAVLVTVIVGKSGAQVRQESS